MKKILCLTMATSLVLCFGCIKNLEEPEAKIAQLLQYDMTITGNGAYEESYKLVLPGLEAYEKTSDEFVSLKQSGETLTINRNYYPEKSQNIELFFKTQPVYQEGLIIKEGNKFFVNPDRLTAKAFIPGLSGDSELRFDYEKSLIYGGNLQLIDNLDIYYQNKQNWEKISLSRNDILAKIRNEMQARGDHSELSFEQSFPITISGKVFSILIEKQKITVKN